MRQFQLLPSFQPLKIMLLGFLLISSIHNSSTLSASAAVSNKENITALSIANNADASNGKTIQAKLLIDAPPQLVWQTLINYPEIKHVLPGYEKSTVLKSSGNTKTVDLGMKVAAFLPTYHYQVQMTENQPAYNLNIKRISGDFKSLIANYKLVPQNNGARTLMIYNLNLDPGFNLPGTQALIKANTEKSMRALQRHIMLEAHKSLIGQR